MRKSLFTVAVLAAAALAARAQAATSITVGDATGDAGSNVSVDVTLTTDAQIAGTQNDTTPAAGVAIVAKAGKCSTTKTTACFLNADCPEGETCKGVAPDCTVNPDIDKTGTSFAFQPPNCQGTACTGIRALVLSLSNTDAIPTGSVLYTCNVSIGADTVAGDYALTNSNAGASDPDGVAVPATAVNGKVTVNGVTPPSDAIIQVGTVNGEVGQSGLSLPVSLSVPNSATLVAGTQNDITFSGGIGAAVEISAKAGKCSTTKTTACFVDGDCPTGETCKGVAPDCTVNADIDKTGTSFAFQPPNCQGELCTGIRALVLSLSNTDPIPDGSVLYTCVVNIKSTAADGQTYPLDCSNAGASDPDGVALSASCTSGSVVVGGVGPTNTPTNTGAPTPTNTPSVVSTATNTPTSASTPTITKKPTNTPGGSTGNDDDGCAVTAPANGGSGWMLLLPAAALLWIRRRSK